MVTQEVNQRLVKQDVPGLRRRQFQGDRMELAVWQNADGDVVHFRMLLVPNLVVDFECNKGLMTAHGKLPRLRRKYFLSPEVKGEDPESLPDITSATQDDHVELGTLRIAFEKLVDNPPSKSKRTVSFVAEVLYKALTAPQDLPQYMNGKLPVGSDSVFGDPAASQRLRDEGERRSKYHGMFGKLMSLLTDD
ncbi:MAG: hypothetical protein HY303_02950 [Candidatus Wallbacteria bacterium]|nr:hypothetical protein [Candidatus Wallbacteria bacterium]